MCFTWWASANGCKYASCSTGVLAASTNGWADMLETQTTGLVQVVGSSRSNPGFGPQQIGARPGGRRRKSPLDLDESSSAELDGQLITHRLMVGPHPLPAHPIFPRRSGRAAIRACVRSVINP
jgi:hypothetical protein